MYCDIVIPNNNEEQFIKIAEALSYKSLCFLYSLENFVKKKSFQETTRLHIFSAIIASKKDFSKAKKFPALVIYEADSADNRQLIENEKPAAIINLERFERKDTIKQRSSGLNNVLAELMVKNKILLAFSLQNIKSNDEDYLGRVMQNISLAQKHKLNCIIASFAVHPYQMKNPKDIVSFFVTLGMNESSAKQSLENVYFRYKLNKTKSEGKIIADGIEEV
ncbi:hypothetical protein J4232_01335 [Candidatus Woesearchaeota archaeon]|nr:hypothetical protein [Candidatus Woesearchaeota archaeon]